MNVFFVQNKHPDIFYSHVFLILFKRSFSQHVNLVLFNSGFFKIEPKDYSGVKSGEIKFQPKAQGPKWLSFCQN